MLAVVPYELIDLALQVRHGAIGVVADGALRDWPDAAVDLIEPGPAGRGRVVMKARVLGESDLYSSVFVGAVVVDDEMNIQMIRQLRFDVTQ